MAKLFRRYKSTLYGNYRKAYLVDGVLVGGVIVLVVVLRDWLSPTPMMAPENWVTEVVLALGIFLSAYLYRKQLPDGKVTLKELMLLGLGIGVVSALVLGLWTWLNGGVLTPSRVEYYNNCRIASMPAADTGFEARQAIEQVSRYTAGDWAFIAAFRSAVMSVILAFFTALVFRTEKAEVRTRVKN